MLELACVGVFCFLFCLDGHFESLKAQALTLHPSYLFIS